MAGIAAVVLIAALLAAGVRSGYGLVSFGFCLFVALTVFNEFYKGSRSIAAKNGINPLRAAVELTHRNTRRYGGYIVHMGIVLMFIGFTGQAFQSKDVKELNQGDSMNIASYTLKMVNLEHGDNDLYSYDRATLAVTKGGEDLGILQPEKRLYKASRQPTSDVALRIRPNEDLYLNFGGMSDDNRRAVIQAFVNPLVSWVWIGGLVLIFGTLICLVPAKIKMQYARTQVVGVASKHVAVSK